MCVALCKYCDSLKKSLYKFNKLYKFIHLHVHFSNLKPKGKCEEPYNGSTN